MAKILSGDSGGGSAPSGGKPNVSKETFNEFVREAHAAQLAIDGDAAALAASKAVLKRVLTRATKAGIDKDDFKWALRQDRMDNDEREASHRRRMQYMEFMDKPAGTQASFAFAGAPGDGAAADMQPETMSEIQKGHIIDAGSTASRAGARADENPWTIGTYAHQVWHEGWMADQTARASELGDDPPKTGRGRRRGITVAPLREGEGASAEV